MSRSSGSASRAATIAPHVLFGALLALNVLRTLHHAMWGDELQAFMIAADSATFADVLHRLHYESHPALWYAIVRVVTRVRADPMAMQIAHAAIAAGVWWLIYRYSPFDPWEKLLLLVGYFFFWEYFVISRNYALMVLLGFGFIALRAHGVRRGILPWLLLGLLANTVVYGAIWSMVMAAFFAIEQMRTDRRALLLGGCVYALLLGFAAWTMAPASDALHVGTLRHEVPRLTSLFAFPVDALAPFPVTWLKGTWAVVTHPRTAEFPKFWNPVPIQALAQILRLDAHPVGVLAIVLASFVACWAIVRDRLVVAELAIGYVAVLLFTFVWHFPGYARHHGIVLLLLIAAVWMVRARDARAGRSWLWWTILGVNALAGLTTLASELRPFSAGRNVATWIEENHLDDAFIVGSADAAVSTVSGYLRRPIYYIESESAGSFVEWSTRRRVNLDPAEVGRRLARALAGCDDAILILNHPVAAETVAAAPRLSLTLQQAFTRAVIPRERYFVYRVRRDPAPQLDSSGGP